MNKKQRRLKSKLRMEQQVSDGLRATLDRHAHQLNEKEKDVRDWEHRAREMRSIADRIERRSDQELARYKFIDDILGKMSKDHTFRGMPLFEYMRGMVNEGVPDSWMQCWPPLMRRAHLPAISWRAGINNDFTSPVESMIQQVLEYYLFDFYNRKPDVDRRDPVLMYEYRGERRAYMLSDAIAKLPDEEAIMVIMREMAPEVLKMVRDNKQGVFHAY